MNIILFLLPYWFAILALVVLVKSTNFYYGKPTVPAALDRMATRIAQGKVPPHINFILKERVPGYLEHYKVVPGRLACRAEPYHDRANDEHVFCLVIGFKEHASKPADRYITIPVLPNGKLYE